MTETDTNSDERDRRAADGDEERMRKIELVRDKIGVTNEQARAALELTDFDVLDAVILLERQGKAEHRTVRVSTAAGPGAGADPSDPADQMTRAQIDYENDTRHYRIADLLSRAIGWCRHMLQRGIDITLVADHHDHQVFSMPLMLLVIVLIAAIWLCLLPSIVVLLIVSLFFDFQYRIEGAGRRVDDFNEMSSKASQTAENLKHKMRDDDD